MLQSARIFTDDVFVGLISFGLPTMQANNCLEEIVDSQKEDDIRRQQFAATTRVLRDVADTERKRESEERNMNRWKKQAAKQKKIEDDAVQKTKEVHNDMTEAEEIPDKGCNGRRNMRNRTSANNTGANVSANEGKETGQSKLFSVIIIIV